MIHSKEKEKLSHVGVSISDSAIEVSEIQSDEADSFSVKEIASADLLSGIVENGKVLDADRLGEALRKLWSEEGHFSKNNIYVAIPDEATYFHVFHLPGSLSDTEVGSAVRFQFEEVFPLAFMNAAVHFIVVARSAEKTVVSCIVTAKEVVDRFKDAFSRANLGLVSLSLEAEAVRRVLLDSPSSQGTSADKKATLVAHFKNHQVMLFVVNAYGLYGSFTVNVEEDNQTPIRTKTFVADEIRKIAVWYEETALSKLDELVLFGSVRNIGEVEESLKRLLKEDMPDLDVRIIDSSSHMMHEHSSKIHGREKNIWPYATSIGAALQGFTSEARTFEFLAFPPKKQYFVKNERVASPAGKRWSMQDIRLYFEAIPERTKMWFSVVFISLAILFFLVVFIRYSRASDKAERDVAELRSSLLQVSTTTPTPTPDKLK
ncbi:MAG: pilus assembly protein PilM [Candidatus Pacebacteria bacterium]|nr:pilus assembly protein PilM [Candidatus Paceibacterota bacterium]